VHWLNAGECAYVTSSNKLCRTIMILVAVTVISVEMLAKCGGRAVSLDSNNTRSEPAMS
jgi:hypothetical protein